MDAIFYLVKCGCPWRYLPADFPPWKTVYHVFRQWIHNHQWAALNDALRILVRKTHGKRSRPTAAILDSQSVKSAGHGGPVGYDAGKRIKGRKRHLLVDTLGLVLGVAVTPANTTERDGAQMLLARVLGWFTWLRILWVDGGYTGETFANWVKGLRPKLAVEVVKRSDTDRRLQSIAAPLGRRAHLRLVDAPAATGARLRNHRVQCRGLDLHRDDPNSTPPTGMTTHHS